MRRGGQAPPLPTLATGLLWNLLHSMHLWAGPFCSREDPGCRVPGAGSMAWLTAC